MPLVAIRPLCTPRSPMALCNFASAPCNSVLVWATSVFTSSDIGFHIGDFTRNRPDLFLRLGLGRSLFLFQARRIRSLSRQQVLSPGSQLPLRKTDALAQFFRRDAQAGIGSVQFGGELLILLLGGHEERPRSFHPVLQGVAPDQPGERCQNGKAEKSYKETRVCPLNIFYVVCHGIASPVTRLRSSRIAGLTDLDASHPTMDAVSSADVVVGGGGIIGLSIALELARSGFRVKVIERGRVMSEASWAAAGMLAAEDPENPKRDRSSGRAQQRSLSGIPPRN